MFNGRERQANLSIIKVELPRGLPVNPNVLCIKPVDFVSQVTSLLSGLAAGNIASIRFSICFHLSPGNIIRE